MTNQFAPDYIHTIAPYQAGKPISEVAREFGLDPAKIIKLASNENPMGMPESARKAAQAALTGDNGRYPDANGFSLKKAVSERYSVPMNWITLGNGSNDIIDIAGRTFAKNGDSIVFSEYSFIVYMLTAKAVGATGIEVPSRNYGHDLDAMLKAIREDTKIVFLANPNNPTGTFLKPEEIEAFLDKVPSNVVVVIDEAYNEFLDDSLQYDSTAWVRKYPNLLVSRTFSKAYGLAALRVGFGLAQPELTDLLNRVRQPFNTNAAAQAAAIVALDDVEFLKKSAENNAQGYKTLTQAFEEMGLEYIPSYGNFVLVKVGNDVDAGARVNLELLKKGIIVRPVKGYKLPEWLRISIGLPEENQAFIKALKEILA